MDNTYLETGCSMHPENDQPMENMPVVGMAYVPMQHLKTMYEPMDGFVIGTIFPELDKPWLPKGCGK
jgi:hypothetical protein